MENEGRINWKRFSLGLTGGVSCHGVNAFQLHFGSIFMIYDCAIPTPFARNNESIE
jgi:hypothetical protein